MVAHGVCCYPALPCSLLEQGAQSTSYPVPASRMGCSATDSLMSMTSWMDPSKGHVISCIPRGMDPSIHPSRGMLSTRAMECTLHTARGVGVVLQRYSH
jgi:hypothetical protein